MLAGEDALLRETSPESPCDKHGPSLDIQMRETAAILSHPDIVPGGQAESQGKAAQAPRGLPPSPLRAARIRRVSATHLHRLI